MAPTSDAERRSSTRLRVAEERRQASHSGDSSRARALRAAKRHGDASQPDDVSTSTQGAASLSASIKGDVDGDHHDDDDDDFVANAPSAPRTSLKRRVSATASPGSPDPLTASPLSKMPRRSARRRLNASIDHGAADRGSRRKNGTSGNRPALARTHRLSSRRRLLANSSRTGKGTAIASSKKQRQATLVKKTSKTAIHDPLSAVKESAVIPPWKELPYFILVSIFQAAADQLPDLARSKWLVGASLVCRDFCEPALTALYQSPPLLRRPMAHKFVELLARDPDSTRFNYRQKVERLHIDVPGVAKGLYQGHGLDLASLIGPLPRLRVLDFYHDLDLPPYRSLDEGFKWRYPDALFQVLGAVPDHEAPADDQLPDLAAMEDPLRPVPMQVVAEKRQATKLTGWRWNRRMMGPDLDIHRIRDLHLTPSFSGLRRIGFLNYQVPSIATRHLDASWEERDKGFISVFASAINALPALEFLTIETSTIVNGDLLSQLPTTLKTLQLINCWDVHSRDFAAYLLTRGRELRNLYLHHNQSLALGFLTVLGEACPHLETLSMDFRYYQHHAFYNDADPAYDEVLSTDQIPAWPASLEVIELMNMRKWTAEAAQLLFKSLVDSAPNLPNLRYLDIRAMLDIPIRQRSEIRDRWTAELERVFLRKWKPPLLFPSLRHPPYQPRKSLVPKKDAVKDKAKSSEDGRRSTRFATLDQEFGSSSRSGSAGRGLRDRSGKHSYAEPDSSDFDLAEEDEEDDEIPPDSPASEATSASPEKDGFIHGMCEFVNVKLDNQKPTEQIWSMNDFLDSEGDDPTDDEWNGDRDINDDHHAW